MAGGELGMARCGEERAAFLGGLGSMVTRRDGKMPAVLRRLGRHAYRGDAANGPAIRGARARTAA
jgi:hypothetical protein